MNLSGLMGSDAARTDRLNLPTVYTLQINEILEPYQNDSLSIVSNFFAGAQLDVSDCFP